MKLQFLDIAIIFTYLLGMLMLGWFMRKKARLSKENYFNGWQKTAMVPVGAKRCFGYV